MVIELCTFFIRTPRRLISNWFSRFCKSLTLNPESSSPIICLFLSYGNVRQALRLDIGNWSLLLTLIYDMQKRLDIHLANFSVECFFNTRLYLSALDYSRLRAINYLVLEHAYILFLIFQNSSSVFSACEKFIYLWIMLGISTFWPFFCTNLWCRTCHRSIGKLELTINKFNIILKLNNENSHAI